MKTIKIGTRSSDLALYQSRLVAKFLEDKGYKTELVKITSKGDSDQRDFVKIAGDGYFTKALEKALLEDQVDLLVHSAKDLPSIQHKSIPWLCFSKRETTKDILICKSLNIKRIATSSPRRTAQLKELYPNADILPIRGNVPTRIDKLKSGLNDTEIDAIVLAKAGVERLGLLDRVKKEYKVIDLDVTTAPCQGILAVQSKDLKLLELLENKDLKEEATFEKKTLQLLGGGCHLALGVNFKDKSFFYNDGAKSYSFQEPQTSNLSSISSPIFFQKILNHLVRPIEDNTEKKFKAKVLLTHSLQNQLKVAKDLAKHNIGSISYPLIEVLPNFNLADILKDLSAYELVFTSPNGVKIFFLERLSHLNTLEDFKESKIYCIGEATKKALDDFGLNGLLVKASADSESFSKELKKYVKNPIYIGNSKQSAFLKRFSENFNYSVPSISVYENMDSKFTPANIDAANAIIFCSPSSVRAFLKKHSLSDLKKLRVYSFGPTTSHELQKNSIEALENPISGSWAALIEKVNKDLN